MPEQGRCSAKIAVVHSENEDDKPPKRLHDPQAEDRGTAGIKPLRCVAFAGGWHERGKSGDGCCHLLLLFLALVLVRTIVYERKILIFLIFECGPDEGWIALR